MKLLLHKNKKRFNPHTVWIVCCTVFISVVILELLVFSWYFVHITTKLDAPAQPTHQTNAAAIEVMQKKLDIVEAALKDRSGIEIDTSN